MLAKLKSPGPLSTNSTSNFARSMYQAIRRPENAAAGRGSPSGNMPLAAKFLGSVGNIGHLVAQMVQSAPCSSALESLLLRIRRSNQFQPMIGPGLPEKLHPGSLFLVDHDSAFHAIPETVYKFRRRGGNIAHQVSDVMQVKHRNLPPRGA